MGCARIAKKRVNELFFLERVDNHYLLGTFIRRHIQEREYPQSLSANNQ
jgi:hypothetical protein